MKTAIALIAMIGFTVTANLLLKIGATVSEGSASAAFVNWRTLAGLASFGVAGLLYAMVLRWLPLNVAVSFLAAQYVGVLVACWIVLGERIQSLQWLGIMLITSGILVIGWSQR